MIRKGSYHFIHSPTEKVELEFAITSHVIEEQYNICLDKKKNEKVCMRSDWERPVEKDGYVRAFLEIEGQEVLLDNEGTTSSFWYRGEKYTIRGKGVFLAIAQEQYAVQLDYIIYKEETNRHSKEQILYEHSESVPSIKLGEKFQLKIEQTPGTGYGVNVITGFGLEFVSKSKEGKDLIYTLEGIAKGTSTVTIYRGRFWETTSRDGIPTNKNTGEGVTSHVLKVHIR